MDYMFKKAWNFNANISWWDVSSVTSMYVMFHDANSFNRDISRWYVSSVTSMYDMFANAWSFNGDILGSDVSSITSMHTMFYNANSFNHQLCWDVGSKSTGIMFTGAGGGKIGCPPSTAPTTTTTKIPSTMPTSTPTFTTKTPTAQGTWNPTTTEEGKNTLSDSTGTPDVLRSRKVDGVSLTCIFHKYIRVITLTHAIMCKPNRISIGLLQVQRLSMLRRS